MTNEPQAAPDKPLTVAEATANLDGARNRLGKAQLAMKDAADELAMAKRSEASHYKAFNAAVAAMRPTRPRKPKTEGEKV